MLVVINLCYNVYIDYRGIHIYMRNTPRPNPISVYLGDKAVYERRVSALDDLASRFNARDARGNISRSVLIQMIADGEISLVKTVGEQADK